MSGGESTKIARRPLRRVRSEGHTPTTTVDIASYVATIIKGMRGLTRNSQQKDLVFLDHLLAVVEEEASTLSTNVYH